MHVTIATRNLRLPDRTQKIIDRKIARLKKRLIHFNPDLVEVALVLEKLPSGAEYRSTLSCHLPMRTLRVVETEGSETQSLNRSFDVLERQLDRFLAQLRGEKDRGGRGGGRPE